MSQQVRPDIAQRLEWFHAQSQRWIERGERMAERGIDDKGWESLNRERHCTGKSESSRRDKSVEWSVCGNWHVTYGCCRCLPHCSAFPCPRFCWTYLELCVSLGPWQATLGGLLLVQPCEALHVTAAQLQQSWALILRWGEGHRWCCHQPSMLLQLHSRTSLLPLHISPSLALIFFSLALSLLLSCTCCQSYCWGTGKLAWSDTS